MEQLQLDVLQDPGPSRAGGAEPALTGEQESAAARRTGALLLSAAAGSGKTSVLVERFVRAVLEDGHEPASLLAITFTERAAGELRERIRTRLLALGERDAARDLEAAFVGTFHSFCARLLRAHPLQAGLDPDFVILDESRAGRLRQQAFEHALRHFLAADGDAAVDLLAAYRADELRRMILGLYAGLRSRGLSDPRLPLAALGRDASDEDRDAAAAIALMDRLLQTFAARYEQAKSERRGVDFDDLELLAGELLQARAGLREAWSQRFELLMVDEFQDTNARQLAILSALERDNLFTVGDELQSIYGFRHADVALFRARREQLAADGASLALRSNFRSRAAILDVVNEAFADRFPAFEALVPGREPDAAAPAEPPVELLLTSKSGWEEDEELAAAVGAGLPHSQTWRQAEARVLAARVAELLRDTPTRAGDVVVLLRATSDLEVFERALQLRGVRTLATVGAFWGHQQIGDLHHYLRALANPCDEEALYSALASPLGGCSRDCLALLSAAREAGQGAWDAAGAICERHGAGLPERDRERFVRFCAWLADERLQAARRGPAELIERVIERSGYREHVLALDWGERRMANVHKLLRLARAFEAEEGPGLRDFVDHVEYLKGIEAAEPDAPVGGAEPDAVRLMSVHAAKGLEFPVVCVADLGRHANLRSPDLLVEGERAGLRLRRLGEGSSTPALAFAELDRERRSREAEEEDRVLYVAMTRARERLLLSGAVDFHDWPEPSEGSPPINWLAPAVCRELVGGAPGAVPCTLSDPARVRALLAGQASASERTFAGERAGPPAAGFAAGAGPAQVPAQAPLPATLSYSSLAELERCGYRYYLERVLGLAEERAPEGGAPRPQGVVGELLDARARGTLVHRVLEWADFAAPEPGWEERVEEAARELSLSVTPVERDEVAALVAGACASPFAARLAAARGVRREHPFAFALGPGEPLVTGVVDLICDEADGAVLVLDYKSDRTAPGEDLAALMEGQYAVQRLVYALAALRRGALAVEVVHWFLERPQEPLAARFTAAERAQLEDALQRRLAQAWTDPFAVSDRPHRALCAGCPGRAALCSWDEEHTLRERPET